MILSYENLPNYEKNVVMVDGCFDPLHIGHIKYFELASNFGFPVVCNIQSDEYINKEKKRMNLLPEKQRIKMIDSIKYISYTHLCKTSTYDVLSKLKPIKYIKGSDWEDKGLPQIEKEICEKIGIEIVYVDANLDNSTTILNNFCKAYNSADTDSFESFIFSQKKIKPQYYNEYYFKGKWRSGDNEYSLEKRRKIEGKNPQNIKDIFKPNRVLDVGCGPGGLMYFLYELGIDPYGIDFSAKAKKLAPAQIRPKIVVAPVTEYYNFGLDFDLVICRELLEHLTLLELKKAVKVLAEYTSKFLYITTRFHPSPRSLLDIATDLCTDPTHITLLNKEFLRALFMLEGLKSRQDLEEKMDWKKLGRVLVFERI